MQQQDQPTRSASMTPVAFVKAASGTIERTMPENPHWYVVRFECRRMGLEEGYAGLVELGRSPAGYDRPLALPHLPLDRPRRPLLLLGMTDDPVWPWKPSPRRPRSSSIGPGSIPGEGRQLGLEMVGR